MKQPCPQVRRAPDVYEQHAAGGQHPVQNQAAAHAGEGRTPLAPAALLACAFY